MTFHAYNLTTTITQSPLKLYIYTQISSLNKTSPTNTETTKTSWLNKGFCVFVVDSRGNSSGQCNFYNCFNVRQRALLSREVTTGQHVIDRFVTPAMEGDRAANSDTPGLWDVSLTSQVATLPRLGARHLGPRVHALSYDTLQYSNRFPLICKPMLQSTSVNVFLWLLNAYCLCGIVLCFVEIYLHIPTNYQYSVITELLRWVPIKPKY
jgi:hypothetical protein